MKEYSAIASIYDLFMSGYNYDGIYDVITKSGDFKSGLDLACGTGLTTIRLAKSGINMCGLDISPQMLEIASSNMRKEGIVIPFVLGDINSFSFDKKFDLITCMCDGINYINTTKLNSVFNNIAKHLNTGGKLVFDISSDKKLINEIGNNFFYEDYEDNTLFWTNKLGKNNKYVDMSISLFSKVENLYQRKDEYHRQYIHTLSDIKDSIAKSRLKILQSLDGNTLGKITAKSSRWLFVTEKR